MTSADFQELVTFDSSTRASFLQYLHERPINRRVSRNERQNLIEWLTNPHKRPSSQQEFSRRNYVQKTFTWDEKTQTLLAASKAGGGKDRMVVTEDMIADIVESVHNNNGHTGWDTTWKDVSASYYGIPRTLYFCLSNVRPAPKILPNDPRALELL
jgi:hypothetical protein